MLKAIWRFLSDVCWHIRAERLAMKFLLISLETVKVEAPVVNLSNTPPGTLPKGPFNLEVIYEDKQALEALGNLHTNDIRMPKHIHDIN